MNKEMNTPARKDWKFTGTSGKNLKHFSAHTEDGEWSMTKDLDGESFKGRKKVVVYTPGDEAFFFRTTEEAVQAIGQGDF